VRAPAYPVPVAPAGRPVTGVLVGRAGNPRTWGERNSGQSLSL
jgi:hypothetical protein